MSELPEVTIIIPFRDRGVDPLRKANRIRVTEWWNKRGYQAQLFSDDREGSAQFNRSVAYNLGVDANPDTDVFVFAESDVLIHHYQIEKAVDYARKSPGLVIPFDEYHYIGPGESESIRRGRNPEHADARWIMDKGRSIGAVNVISRETYDLVGGYDECFEGSWYDDDAMKVAFEKAAGDTRWVRGPLFHLYHLPGNTGSHLSEEDIAATERNKARLARYCSALTADEVRALTREGR